MNYLFFSFCLFVGVILIGEGCSILLWKKPITPMPSRILCWLGVVMVGSERSQQQYLGKTSENDLRVYGLNATIFGVLVVGASFIYLFSSLL